MTSGDRAVTSGGHGASIGGRATGSRGHGASAGDRAGSVEGRAGNAEGRRAGPCSQAATERTCGAGIAARLRSDGAGVAVRRDSAVPTEGDLCTIPTMGAGDGKQILMLWPPPPNERGLPMVCITPCDALAYCESIGKRLCKGGSLDGGTSMALSDPSDEWYAACSGGGTRVFAYGDMEDPNAYDAPNAPAGEGAYLGLFGMSGGAQYTDSCIASADGPCTLRGYDCAWGKAVGDRSSFDPWTGFRCCADP